MKNKKILFAILLIFIFFLSMGLTYAFFDVIVNNANSPQEILTSTGTLELTYNGGPAISANDIFPGWSSIKTITVTNTGSLNVSYSINWESITNTFIEDELVMSMTCTGEGCATIDEQPVGTLVGPFVDQISIAPGVTHTYELTLTFIDTGSLQNYNQGKLFSGIITIAESGVTGETYRFFNMYGTLVNASDEPIAGATVTLHSSPRTAITDENGNFMFEAVEADDHTITATVAGEEILSDSLTIINGERTAISDTTVTRRTRTQQINVKIKSGSNEKITSIEKVHYTLSPDWQTILEINGDYIIAIAVETTLESPSTYTYDGVTYNRNRNGVDVSEDGDGTVLASTYTDETNEVIIMINSRGMTSLPEDSSVIFSNYDSGLNSLEYLQTENLDTSQTIYMTEMFFSLGSASQSLHIDLTNWDTSQVTDMSDMFNNLANTVPTWSIGDLSNWDTSQVQDMYGMFFSMGSCSKIWNVGDISNWDVSQVTNMSHMFESTGYEAEIVDINLNSWNTSNVSDMSDMFKSAGYGAEIVDINLSGWDTSQVTNMAYMFNCVGYNATTFNLDLGTWDTSQVTDMNEMFFYAGHDATTSTLNIKGFNLSSSNTTLTSYDYIFDEMNSNTQVIVGSVDAKNWIMGLDYHYRPTAWTSSSIIVDQL